jgi:hypothetical protein
MKPNARAARDRLEDLCLAAAALVFFAILLGAIR